MKQPTLNSFIYTTLMYTVYSNIEYQVDIINILDLLFSVKNQVHRLPLLTTISVEANKIEKKILILSYFNLKIFISFIIYPCIHYVLPYQLVNSILRRKYQARLRYPG